MTDLSVHIPTYRTDRLVLRAPELADFDALATFYETERSIWHGGPLPRHRVWGVFTGNLGHWLLRGFGLWTLVERATGTIVGRCGLWEADGWRVPELAWTVFDGFEGRGLAFEAADRIRTAAFSDFGLTELASPIHPDNTRSIALAQRLGAVSSDDWTMPNGAPATLYRFNPA